jgi:tetratricopeptide (TPR) repeat protein
LALTVLVAVACGWYLLRPRPAPEPPEVNLANSDRDVAETIQKAQEAVRAKPRSSEAWGRFGIVLLAHDFRAEANTCFAEAERLDPREPRWPYLQGMILQRGTPEQALPKLRRAVELCGKESAPRLRLAEELLAQGQLDSAEEMFEAADHPDEEFNMRVLLGFARIGVARGHAEENLDLLRGLTQDPRTRKAAHILLAEVYGRTPGKEKEAAAEREVVARLPDDVDWPDPYLKDVFDARRGKKACIETVNQLRRQGRLREAAGLLKDGTGRYPDSDYVWMAYGRVLADLHDQAGAVYAYGKAIALAPDRFEPRYRLGLALYDQRALAEAADAFRVAARLSPADARAHFWLGKVLQTSGRVADLPEAIAAYRAALRCQPNYAEAQRGLGVLLVGVAREAELAGHLQCLLRCPAVFDLAVAFRAEAQTHLRHAERLAPKDKETRAALDGLRREFP